jgi:Fe-S cluster assembly protein SufD
MQNENINEEYINQMQQNLLKRKLSVNNTELFSSILESFKNVGIPSHKSEVWRYSKIKNHLPKKLSFLDQFDFDQATELINNCYSLVILGNRIDLKLSSLPKAKAFKIEAQTLENNINLDSLQYDSNDSLDSLSLINAEEIIQISIDSSFKLDKPLQLIYYPLKKSEEVLFSPRINIELNEKSSLELIEYFPEGPCNINYYLSIKCGKGSELKHTKLNFTQNTHVGNLSIIQDDRSQFKSFIFSSGSELSRSHIKTTLNGSYAHAEINGLYALANDVHSDQYIEIFHNAPDTTSEQLFKGILSDSSHGVFTGKVTIARDAQRVNANQLNKNLLLSKKARVDTRPSLEVYADDVKCTHGATTGQLDEEQLFYLISRGIKEETAYSLLIHGFIDDALSKIDNSYIKALIGVKVLNEFKNKISL